MIKAQDFEAKGFLGQITGPIFLMCTLFLAGHSASVPNYDLALIAVVGLFLCAKWPLRGSLLALSLLAVCAGAKHFFMNGHHLWQAGFEGSVAISFIICALVFREKTTFIEALDAQNLAHTQTIQFLEDDLVKQKHLAAEENLVSSEKVNGLQAQLEEAISESSSYQMLNDVVRKSTARALEEKEIFLSQCVHSERKSGQLLSEIDVLQKELCRIGNESLVVQQNGQLFSELNTARVKEAQTHLVNETLARMHRSENERVKVLEAREEVSLEQLLNAQTQIQQFSQQIEELTSKLDSLHGIQTHCETLSDRVQSIEVELAIARQQVQMAVSPAREALLLREIETLESGLAVAMQQVQMAIPPEREAFLLKEIELLESNLATAVQQVQMSVSPEREAFLLGEIESLSTEKNQIGEVDGLKEQLEILQTRLEQFVKIERLYRELKGNFEEKNAVLHKTRVELFHTDTELQTLKQEIQQKDLEVEFVPQEIVSEIEDIASENSALTLENSILQDLITHLMGSEETSVKKKVKKKVLAEQQDLFIPDELF